MAVLIPERARSPGGEPMVLGHLEENGGDLLTGPTAFAHDGDHQYSGEAIDRGTGDRGTRERRSECNSSLARISSAPWVGHWG